MELYGTITIIVIMDGITYTYTSLEVALDSLTKLKEMKDDVADENK